MQKPVLLVLLPLSIIEYKREIIIAGLIIESVISIEGWGFINFSFRDDDELGRASLGRVRKDGKKQ